MVECLTAAVDVGAYCLSRLEEARSRSDGLGFGGMPPAVAKVLGEANLRFMDETLMPLMLILRSEAFRSSSSSFKSVYARSKHKESVAPEFSCSCMTSSFTPSSQFAAASFINYITCAYCSIIDFLSAYGSCQSMFESFYEAL